MSESLTEFLSARLDEDEAFWPIAVDCVELIGRQFVNAQARADADIDAKRQIVEYLTPLYGTDYDLDSARHAWATLRFLARPYADHPDYRQEWRP